MIKSFDLFQKLNVENISKPTLLGSILSLTAISLMIYLILREISSYLAITIKKDSIIFHDEDQTSKIPVNLSFHFYSTTCNILSVDQEDMIGNHRLDIMDTLTKTRVDKNGNPVTENDKNLYNPTITAANIVL